MRHRDQTVRDLTVALGILEERGVCKKVIEDRDGRVCLLGAINLAVWKTTWGGPLRIKRPYTKNRTRRDRAAVRAVEAVARERHPRLFAKGGVPAVNDAPSVRPGEVKKIVRIAKFRLEHAA